MDAMVVVDDSGLVKFQTVEDGCNEGGFTRNYIFANMTQELIQEQIAGPLNVTVSESTGETRDNAALESALQHVAGPWVDENGMTL